MTSKLESAGHDHAGAAHSSSFARLIQSDADALTLRSVISTSRPDRAGDLVIPKGLSNRDEYLRNPVVLWAHQRTLPPIGTCQSLEVFPDRIEAVTQFAKGVPFAEDVFRLYEQGVLRGWSIAFIPKVSVPMKRGYRIEEWHLLEYSAVPVPENPEALTRAICKGLVRDAALHGWLTRAVDVFSDLLV